MTPFIIGWIIAIVAFISIEAATIQLVSIWFMGGALAGMIAAMCGLGFVWQFGLFVVVSAATLMLQLYGFIAVPDGPLMFTTALFLLTFKWFSENRRRAWLWMGIAMALMAYSKYHGALVVLFALAANPRQLLRPALYSSGAVALLLLVPVVGVTYEFNRYVGGHDNPVTNALAKPGLWLQNFTTNEPDDSMLEVAIRAMELVIPEQKGKDEW